MKKQTLFSIASALSLSVLSFGFLSSCTTDDVAPRPVSEQVTFMDHSGQDGSVGTLIPVDMGFIGASKVYNFPGHNFMSSREKTLLINGEAMVNLDKVDFYLVTTKNQKIQYHPIPGPGESGYSLYTVQMVNRNTSLKTTQILIKLENGPGEDYTAIRAVIKDGSESIQ